MMTAWQPGVIFLIRLVFCNQTPNNSVFNVKVYYNQSLSDLLNNDLPALRSQLWMCDEMPLQSCFTNQNHNRKCSLSITACRIKPCFTHRTVSAHFSAKCDNKMAQTHIFPKKIYLLQKNIYLHRVFVLFLV